MKKSAFAAFLLLSLCGAARAQMAPPAVDASTAPVRPRTIEDIYQGGRYRDPFIPLTGASAMTTVSKEFVLEDFSIHELQLKGIMRDGAGAYALLIDQTTRAGFILRDGRLYDYKNKRIPGVTGRIDLPQKSVVLVTVDKDVQTLRLGEDEDEDKKDPEEG